MNGWAAQISAYLVHPGLPVIKYVGKPTPAERDRQKKWIEEMGERQKSQIMMVVLEVMEAALEWEPHPSWGPVSFPTVDGGSLKELKVQRDRSRTRDHSIVSLRLLQSLHFIVHLCSNFQQILIIYCVPGVGPQEIEHDLDCSQSVHSF